MKSKKKRYFRTIFILVLAAVLVAVCYCPHKVTYTKIVKEATCTEKGQMEIICERCDKIIGQKDLAQKLHVFGEYELKVEPTPIEPGLEVRKCFACLKEEERECFLELANNSIYITGTDIQKGFTISSFTQWAVDSYDIVYTEGSMLGSNDPFVLGHRYGTLGLLYQTKVGANIYLNLNGVIEVYEVVISEYGLQNSSMSDIIGQTTGTSMWHSYGGKTLHMYTCYGNDRNGRWLVLAKKIQ